MTRLTTPMSDPLRDTAPSPDTIIRRRALNEAAAREQQMRLACLELAANSTDPVEGGIETPDAIVTRARAYADFVIGKAGKPDSIDRRNMPLAPGEVLVSPTTWPDRTPRLLAKLRDALGRNPAFLRKGL